MILLKTQLVFIYPKSNLIAARTWGWRVISLIFHDPCWRDDLHLGVGRGWVGDEMLGKHLERAGAAESRGDGVHLIQLCPRWGRRTGVSGSAMGTERKPWLSPAMGRCSTLTVLLQKLKQ